MSLSPRSQAGHSRLWTIWLSSAVSALLLSLTVSGTLSSWSQAVVRHDGNSISTGTGGVALEVDGPADATCLSSDGADNSVSCAINLYGNAGATVSDLRPGQTVSTTVSLSNAGEMAGTTLAFAPGSCTGSTALCGSALVGVVCSGAATLAVTPTTMNAFANADATFLGTLQPLGVNVSTCVFSVTLPLTAPLTARNQTLTQEVVWTLTA